MSDSSVKELMAQALAAFLAKEREKEEERAAEERKIQEQFAEENKMLRAWLAQQIPPEMVDFIDFSDDDSALDINPRRPTVRYLVTPRVPDSAPIRFLVDFDRRDGEFSFADGQPASFFVPTGYRVLSDPDWNDGEPYIHWQWQPHATYEGDFMLALGEAIAFWQRNRQKIENALNEARAKQLAAKAGMQNPDAPQGLPKELTPEESIARSLGKIAFLLEAHFGFTA